MELSLHPIILLLFFPGGLFLFVAGLLYGAWVDNADRGGVVLGLLAFVSVLAVVLGWLHRRRRNAIHAT